MARNPEARHSVLSNPEEVLVNLARSAWLTLGFVRRLRPFADLERWQTTYLPAYPAWAAVVVLVLPPAFAFA